jgi:transcriptional regulator with XRE-family HTH domain
MPSSLAALGAVIRLERKARGLSQESLAALAGLSRAYVGEIERGEVNVSFTTLVCLADGLNIALSDLVLSYGKYGQTPCDD